HWSSARDAWRSRPIAGLATATMVPSSATIITPKEMATRVAQGLPRRPRAAARAGGVVVVKGSPDWRVFDEGPRLGQAAMSGKVVHWGSRGSGGAGPGVGEPS